MRWPRLGYETRPRPNRGRLKRSSPGCGAWFYRDQATVALRRLGLRRRQRPANLDGALASLSERERLVAELVALGKSEG